MKDLHVSILLLSFMSFRSDSRVLIEIKTKKNVPEVGGKYTGDFQGKLSLFMESHNNHLYITIE